MAIVYFTKQYQAVPALIPIYREAGGTLVSTRSNTLNAIRQVYPEAGTARLHEHLKWLSAGDRLMHQADLIVTGSPNHKLLERYPGKKCMVFHGTYAFMAQNEIDGLEHFDTLCVIGPRMKEALENAGLASKIINSGYLPFMDFLARNPETRARLLQELGLNPQQKTLLYLPRGRPYGSWDVMAERLLWQIPYKYNLIMRPHPSQSVTARIHDRFGFARLTKMAKARGNALLDLASIKHSTLLSIADLVISDGASSPEESLFYDLPLVFVESDGSSPTAIAAMMRGKLLSESYIEQLLTLYQCGMRISPDSHDIGRVIDMSLAEAEQFGPNREQYFQWVFGDRSTVRQQQAIQVLRADA